MAKEASEEYITVYWQRGVPYKWKVGEIRSRFFKEARDNKRLVANRCPKCKELLFPPYLVCGRCKVRAGEELIEVSDKGTVLSYNPIVMRVWNPWIGDWYEDPHPGAVIKLDSGVYIYHRLEETDLNKLKPEMRVQAVWKEEGRGQGVQDILYFRTIEE